jgi:hypothetical protein
VCALAQYSAFCTFHIHTQKKIKKTIHKQIQKCCCSSVKPSGVCKTMAECDKSAVISENPPDMDSTDMMDTSWNVSSASRKRAPKPAMRNDKKFMKSTDSLVDASNRFDGLTDEEEGEVLAPSSKVPPTPPPKPTKRQSLTSAQTPVVAEQPKRVRVPSMTIKWELTRVRSEIVLSNMKNNNFLLKQIHGGTVVKIATMDEYDAFFFVPNDTFRSSRIRSMPRNRPESSCWAFPTCQWAKYKKPWLNEASSPMTSSP